MNQPASRPSSAGKFFYIVTVLGVAAATAGIMYLWQNINDRQEEAKEKVFRVVDITEDTIDPAEWGKNYPRQYDSYLRTVDTERTRYGGSEAFQKLDQDPEWREFFAGYGFALDYREERGHAYMLVDQEETERVTKLKQPGACLQCHASIMPAYRHEGKKAGIPDDQPEAQVQKGFEIVCGMPYAEARHLTDAQGNPLVNHPVACIDCHAPNSLQLRITRPGFLNGIRALAKSDEPVPHLPSIERWRKGDRKDEFNPNTDASRQEMRSMVCGQCHVEYYFKGEQKVVTYPWANGLKADQIGAYYDEQEFTDWKHKTTGASMLKAQHPEFEMWSQGIHARSGVSCADCHMPYKREGAVKISDHHVRSPLLNVSRACQTCHRYDEQEIIARAEAIQERTRMLLDRGEAALLSAIEEIKKAQEMGVDEASLAEARELHRQAQWRLDFVSAENSMGFHAPQESARNLGAAIDLARQCQIAAIRAQNGSGADAKATEKPAAKPEDKTTNPTPPDAPKADENPTGATENDSTENDSKQADKPSDTDGKDSTTETAPAADKE
jgi:nitrite reductase (cytochrome c-552)